MLHFLTIFYFYFFYIIVQYCTLLKKWTLQVGSKTKSSYIPVYVKGFLLSFNVVFSDETETETLLDGNIDNGCNGNYNSSSLI